MYLQEIGIFNTKWNLQEINGYESMYIIFYVSGNGARYPLQEGEITMWVFGMYGLIVISVSALLLLTDFKNNN